MNLFTNPSEYSRPRHFSVCLAFELSVRLLRGETVGEQRESFEDLVCASAAAHIVEEREDA